MAFRSLASLSARMIALTALSVLSHHRAAAQAPYCLGGATVCLEHISHVTLAGIDHGSGCGNATGYSNFSASVPAGAMTAGQPYAVTVTNPVPNVADSVYMWIDWGMDDLLGNATDEIYQLTSTDGGATFTRSFTCPATIANGQRRVRFRINNSSISQMGFLSCGILTSRGEVEDYTVTVTGGRTINVTSVPSELCTGVTFQLDFSTNGVFHPGNVFTAQLSNAAGGFGAPVDLGSTPGITDGTITGMISSAVPAGAGYRIRVVSSNPITFGPDNGSNIHVFPGSPTVLTWTAAVDSLWLTVGNWDNPCAIPTLGDAVYIPAGVRPPVGIPAISLSELRLDNAAGLRLSASMLITSVLELTDGCIVLGNSNLALTSTAAITSAGSGAFVVTNGAGELRQAGVGTGLRSGPILFPVGTDAASYTPAIIENRGTVDEYRIRVSDSARLGGSVGTAVAVHAVNKTWQLSEVNAGGSDVSLQLQWNAQDELPVFHRGGCFVAKYSGGGWAPLRAPDVAIGSDPFSVACTGITSFSLFTVADTLSLVPVDLVTYGISRVDAGVLLVWSTTDERQNAGFEILRRTRREADWQRVGVVPPQGKSGGSYSFLDTRPACGAAQYRLVQTDYNGARTEYPPLDIVVDAAPPQPALAQVHPNPAVSSAVVTIALPEASHARLVLGDLLGREHVPICDAPLEAGSHQFSVDVSQLSSGIYRIMFSSAGVQTSRVLMVVRR